jgi:EAL domain-containing protein (putative c-di-GMP-specific phosphodiesterase class I)
MILALGTRPLAAYAGFQWTPWKIDRTFISHVDSDSESREIVRSIIMLAHNLGLKVVAEGVETEEHVTFLKQLNCEMAQGYFFSRPADDQAMLKLLVSNHSARTASAGS